MQGMEALRASFGGLLSTSTRRAAAGAQVQAAAAAAASMAVPAGFDQAAMEKFADRVGKQINPEGGSTGDTTHVHVAVKGMISPDNLKKVVKKINRAVQNRQTTLKASDSLRVTRRSQ
jgi:heterodisulfide reductase subunit C